MLPDRVSNPGPLTYESGALPTALHGPAVLELNTVGRHMYDYVQKSMKRRSRSANEAKITMKACMKPFKKVPLTLLHSERLKLYGVLAILSAI